MEDGEYHARPCERNRTEIWGARTIPIALGALGTISQRLKENLRTIGVDTSIELTLRSALLGRARILREVLEM